MTAVARIGGGLLTRMRTFISALNDPPKTFPIDFWQRDMRWSHERSCATVEAVIGAYAQTIAQLEIVHASYDDQETRTIRRTTPLARVLRNPNHYQTRSDFFLNLIRSLLSRGNGYAIALRDDGQRIRELHPVMPMCAYPMVDRQTGDIFYSVSSGTMLDFTEFMVEGRILVPQRDMLHVRLHTPHHPLIGETPLAAAAAGIAANTAISAHQAAFFENMSRPSGVLTTDQKLNTAQANELRQRWEDMSQGLNAGRVPILTNGLKWDSLSLTANDSQIIDAFRMSVEDIARAFRVPLPLVNIMSEASFNNVEQLMQFWLASGLGFMLDHVELCCDRLFELGPNQLSEFNEETLLRTDFKGRMEAYGTAVTKGIFSPNEVRRKEGLPPVEGGDMPRVQQQMIPLDWKPGTDTPDPEPADGANDEAGQDGAAAEDEPPPEGQASADNVVRLNAIRARRDQPRLAPPKEYANG
ncbi:MAG: phage portal protein [Pikeienuella sp.]|uniref:phage portal protein n=1 Tax=Pikeienuella sp. TaxID=2831957 RepID=UPI00391C626A